MLKRIVYILITLFVHQQSIAQITTFRKVYGEGNYNFGRCVLVDNKGNIVITGSINVGENSESDIFILKIDSLGRKLWNAIIEKPGIDWGISMQEIKNEGYIISGYTSSDSSGYDVLLMKTDTVGNELWSKHYGGSDWDFGYSVTVLPDGGFVISGETYSYGNGNADIYLIRTNNTGDTLWTKTLGSSGEDRANSVKLTSDGNLVLSGCVTDIIRGFKDLYIMKLDLQGNVIWNKRYGNALDNEGNAVTETMDGGYIAVGYTGSSDSTRNNSYIVRTDLGGDSLWTKKFNWNKDDQINDVIENSDGSFVYTGFKEGFGSSPDDALIFKTFSNGDWQYGGSFGGVNTEETHSVKAIPGGGYIAVGTTYSYGSSVNSVYVIKTDETISAKDTVTSITNVKNIYLKNIQSSIQPNPFSERTKITLNSRFENLGFQVFDVLGRAHDCKWLSFFEEDRTSIEISGEGLLRGIYFYKILSNNRIVNTGKLIVE